MKKKIVIPAVTILAVILLALFAWLFFFRPLVIPFYNAGNGQTDSGGSVTMSVEFPVYDKSCEYVTLLIENGSSEPIEFGDGWSLEKNVLGSWMHVPFRPDVGVNSILRILQPGETYADDCWLTLFYGTLEDGEYRIVKELGDTQYYAGFAIGESEITVESPFGYVPLGYQMIGYDAERAQADGACMYDDGKLGNEENFLAFLRSSQIRGKQAQVRLYEKVNEKGDILITDVTRLRSGAYRVIIWDQPTYDRVKMSILSSSDIRASEKYASELEEAVTIRYYSYLVTDGSEIRLSDYSDITKGEPSDNDLLLVPKESISDDVKQWMKHEYEVPAEFTYSVWNREGTRCVHTNPLAKDSDERRSYYVNQFSEHGTGTRGMTYGLHQDLFRDTKNSRIVEFVWQDEHTLMVAADDGSGMLYYEFRDTDTDERLSCTRSQYDYVIKDGEILIPE